jgi:hypothetical protein
MNKKLNFLIILLCLLALGAVLIGCDNGSTDSNTTPNTDPNPNPNPNTDPKTIIVTGIPKSFGSCYIYIMRLNSDDTIAAAGVVSGDLTTFSIKTRNHSGDAVDWTGSGPYILMLSFRDSAFLYTDGKSFADLGMPGNPTQEQAFSRLPKYNITDATSTIDFTKFAGVPAGLIR